MSDTLPYFIDTHDLVSTFSKAPRQEDESFTSRNSQEAKAAVGHDT